MANLSAKIRLPAVVLALLAISSSVQGNGVNLRYFANRELCF